VRSRSMPFRSLTRVPGKSLPPRTRRPPIDAGALKRPRSPRGSRNGELLPVPSANPKSKHGAEELEVPHEQPDAHALHSGRSGSSPSCTSDPNV
jgi:hypothetical protein